MSFPPMTPQATQSYDSGLNGKVITRISLGLEDPALSLYRHVEDRKAKIRKRLRLHCELIETEKGYSAVNIELI